MSKLPSISGRTCIAALRKLGFSVHRQRGSHIILKRVNPANRVVVPGQAALDKGTLRAIIRETGLTVEEFSALLSRGQSYDAPLFRNAWGSDGRLCAG